MESAQTRRPVAPHPKELPPCKGPKLQAFQYHDSPIERLGRLDEGLPESSDAGRQGYVFKVRIESQLYALKVFKFFNPEDTRSYWEVFIEGDNPETQAELHLDPFYAECRAYGRINMAKKQGKLKHDIAIPCLGFLYLDECHRTVLDEYGVDLDEDCLEGDFSSDSSPSPRAQMQCPARPIRSIVKQLASPNSGITARSINKIRRDIQELNWLQVYNLDIQPDNFRDGKLVDFGSAMTEPHCLIRPENELLSQESRHGDMRMLEYMADEAGILVTWRTKANKAYTRKLRSSSKRKQRRRDYNDASRFNKVDV